MFAGFSIEVFAKWPRQKAEAVIDFVRTLDGAPDMTRLTVMLAG